MAKLTGPLFSLTASGTVGKTVTYSQRNGQAIARTRVIPTNPRVADQVTARQRLAAIQSVTKRLIAGAITAIKAVAPTPSEWSSYMLKNSIGVGASLYTAYDAVFTALTAPQKTSWDDAFVAVVVPEVPGDPASVPTSGEAAFIYASALFYTGAITAPGVPDDANFAAWATAMVP